MNSIRSTSSSAGSTGSRSTNRSTGCAGTDMRSRSTTKWTCRARKRDNPESQASDAERSRWIQRALMTLSSNDRTVLTLRHFSDCSYQEIAQILDLDEKTVKSRLFEARQRLRELLKEYRRTDHEPDRSDRTDEPGPRRRGDRRGGRTSSSSAWRQIRRPAPGSTSCSGCSTASSRSRRRSRRRGWSPP